MMKNSLLLIFLTLLLNACSLDSMQTVQDITGTVELEFPFEWVNNDGNHPFDLQMFSAKKEVTTGVFVYKTEDLSENSTPEKLLEFQVEDLKSKRENFEFIGTENFTIEAASVISSTYSGENGSTKSMYRFSAVEFNDNSNILVIILQTGLPSRWNSYDTTLQAIVKSIKLVENPT